MPLARAPWRPDLVSERDIVPGQKTATAMAQDGTVRIAEARILFSVLEKTTSRYGETSCRRKEGEAGGGCAGCTCSKAAENAAQKGIITSGSTNQLFPVSGSLTFVIPEHHQPFVPLPLSCASPAAASAGTSGAVPPRNPRRASRSHRPPRCRPRLRWRCRSALLPRLRPGPRSARRPRFRRR